MLINLESRLRQEMAQGQYHLALRTTQALIEAAPENSYYRAQRALALLRLGQPERAFEIVRNSEVGDANRDISLEIAWQLCVRTPLQDRGCH